MKLGAIFLRLPLFLGIVSMAIGGSVGTGDLIGSVVGEPEAVAAGTIGFGIIHKTHSKEVPESSATDQ